MTEFAKKAKLSISAALSALWLLPAPQQPAFAEVMLPSDFVSSVVPHDVPTGTKASIQDLAIFAWREFIALNWVASNPAVTGVRGRPSVTDAFLTIRPDTNGSFPLLVWQTYQHKNELFPVNGITNSSFDSRMPTYGYKSSPVKGDSDADFTLFNNLDETSEIGLCNIFAHSNIRIAYEAKVNRAIFDYANTNKLTHCDNKGNCKELMDARTKTKNNLSELGGICSKDSSIVSLPCGRKGVSGDAGEGAIEIKAAWRQLTSQEADSGRFYKRKVIYYTGKPYSNQTYQNAVYGLVALHIIHKTESFPDFVFASWEQVDDYDDATDHNTQNLEFVNSNQGIDNIPVKRAHRIHSEIPPVNDAVHKLFTSRVPTTVWQYYKLIGVQATPVNGPPNSELGGPLNGKTTPENLADLESYYYLANIVVETNQALQNFFGKIQEGKTAPFQNLYLHGAQGSPFQMGGCQGCHGTQAQSVGGDMSRLIAGGPSNANIAPESIDSTSTMTVKSYQDRSANVDNH